jgi:hypothetical protein
VSTHRCPKGISPAPCPRRTKGTHKGVRNRLSVRSAAGFLGGCEHRVPTCPRKRGHGTGRDLMSRSRARHAGIPRAAHAIAGVYTYTTGRLNATGCVVTCCHTTVCCDARAPQPGPPTIRSRRVRRGSDEFRRKYLLHSQLRRRSAGIVPHRDEEPCTAVYYSRRKSKSQADLMNGVKAPDLWQARRRRQNAARRTRPPRTARKVTA